MPERLGEVEKQNLPRILVRQRRAGVDGQRRGTGPALGREERGDRCRGAPRLLRLGGVGRGQLLLPQLVEADAHRLDVGPEGLHQAVPVERQQSGVGEAVDAGDIAVAAAGSGEDQEVARLRPARQHDLAGAV